MADRPPVTLAPGDTVVVNSTVQPTLQWTDKTHTGVRVINPAPPPVDPPDPPGPSMYLPVYGPGIGFDSKNNHQIGWNASASCSYRFRATGGPVTHVAVNKRGGAGYSGGNGGQLKLAFQEDVDGLPSGHDLASVTSSPGVPSPENKSRVALSYTLIAGRLYHLVATNPSTSQKTNYISLNCCYVPKSKPIERSAFSADLAVLYKEYGDWVELKNELPCFDITYADGRHDGQGYYQITVTTSSPTTQTVISGNAMVRERFTPKKDVTLTSLAFRLKRLSGTGKVTLSLDGTDVAISLDGTVIPISPSASGAGSGSGLNDGRTVKGAIPPTVCKAGQTYAIRASTDAATKYQAVPLRAVAGETSPPWGARTFDEGTAERSTNGGSSWGLVYPDGNHDWQCYGDLRT